MRTFPRRPSNCGRVEILIETCPDARNPYETVPRCPGLMRFASSPRKRSEEDMRESFPSFAESSYHYAMHSLALLDAHFEVSGASWTAATS